MLNLNALSHIFASVNKAGTKYGIIGQQNTNEQELFKIAEYDSQEECEKFMSKFCEDMQMYNLYIIPTFKYE